MSQPPLPHRSHSPARLAVCLLLVGAATIAGVLWRWRSLDDFVGTIDHGDRLFEDFLRFWRPAGQALLDGRAQDAGYYLTPTFALLMLPFGAMSETAAVVAWGVLEATAALLLFLVPGLLLRRRSPDLLAAYAICCATSVPLLHDLAWGQLSSLLALLITGSLLLHRRGRTWPAAALLAFAITIKFYGGLFLLWFLLRGDRRFVARTLLLTALLLLLPPIAVVGLERTLQEYAALVERLGQALPGVVHDTNSQSLGNVAARALAALARRLPALEPALPALGLLARAAGLLLLVASIGLAARDRRRTLLADLHGFTVLWLCLPLVVETSWPHYFVFLPLVQTVLWSGLWALPGPARRRPLLAVSIALSLVLASTPLQQAIGAFRHGYLGLLLVADLLLLAVAWSWPRRLLCHSRRSSLRHAKL